MDELQKPANESMEFEVRPQKLRLRGGTIGLVALGLVAVLAVGVVAGALVNRAAAPQGDPLAKIMPADSILYFTMTTHPEEQDHYDVIAKAWKDSKEARQIESALGAAITASGFDWDADIRPWLGDRVAVGVVDLGGYDKPTAGDSGATDSLPRYRAPFFVVAVQTRDRAKSDAFLADFREARQTSLGSSRLFDETYRGIPIVYVVNDSAYMPEGEAYATVNDAIVFTLGSGNLKRVIDVALDGASLATDTDFRTSMEALPAWSVGAFYMDYGGYMDAMLTMTEGIYGSLSSVDGTDAAQQIDELRRQQREQAEKLSQMFRGLGVAMSYEPSGIRFDVALQFDLESMPESMRALYAVGLTAAPNRIFDAIPASAVLAVNMNDPAATWKPILSDRAYWSMLSTGTPPFGFNGEDVPAKIAEFEQKAGIDLESDFLDLLNGELALVVLPAADPARAGGDPYSFFPRLPFELAVVADSSDAARAAASLDQLAGALLDMAGQGSLQPLDSLPATALLGPDGGMILAYGAIDGRLVIGSNVDTLRAIDTADQAPLSADATFTSATSVLSPDRLTTAYARFEPVWQWFESASGSECAACNYLRPIQWMSISGDKLDATSGMMRETMHIGIQP